MSGEGTARHLFRGALRLSAEEVAVVVAASMLAHPVTFAVAHVGAMSTLRALTRIPALRRPGLPAERFETLVKRGFFAVGCAGTCVPQAAIHYVIQSLFGPEPRLVIGVRKDQVSKTEWLPDAHAWVERWGESRDFGELLPILALAHRVGLQRFDQP